jgi:hypothetical protein
MNKSSMAIINTDCSSARPALFHRSFAPLYLQSQLYRVPPFLEEVTELVKELLFYSCISA